MTRKTALSFPIIGVGFLIVIGLSLIAIKLTRERREQRPEQSSTKATSDNHQFWTLYKRASQERAGGRLEEAIALYQQALLLKPNHEDSLYYLGNCYVESHRYTLALRAYEDLISVNPLGSSRGYMQLGLIYSSLEPGAPLNPEKARQLFEKTLQIDPDSGALLGTGEVAVLCRDWSKAWTALQATNLDNPMSMAAPYLMGYLRFRKGDRQGAWEWFRTAVQRGELKKPAVKWTEEGDVKADPELRWRALARQSVFGKHWLPLRRYLKTPDLQASVMEQEYTHLNKVLHGLSGKKLSPDKTVALGPSGR